MILIKKSSHLARTPIKSENWRQKDSEEGKEQARVKEILCACWKKEKNCHR